MTARIEIADEAGCPAYVLTSPGGHLSATFVPGLNMLCTSLRHDGEELLHPRAGVAAYAEKGKTCGIPLLHPWANRLAGDRYDVDGRTVTLTGNRKPPTRDANGLPNHGLLGGRTAWKVLDTTACDDDATMHARFDFDGRAQSRPLALDRIGAPLLILQGSGSPAITARMTARLHAEVPASGRIVLDGCGHMGPVQVPAAVAAAIEAAGGIGK